jgi:flagellar secretion chaperone FliS
MSNVPARAAAAYGRAAQTIPPVRQVVMLYDGALRRLREARQAILEERIEDRFLAVQKASALIDGLHACLDFERGGDIAPLLDRMYGYIGLRLQQINIRQDPAICDELITQLGELRRAWNTLAEGSAPFSSGPTNPTGACAAA